jgi:DNA-binding GntR family transcriptional regulator
VNDENQNQRRESRSDYAYHEVKAMILECRLPGGRTIVEGQLATKQNVSRTPMREALGRLAGEGLLTKQASRSYSVRHVSASEFFQSMRVRELLEVEAVRQAEGRIDQNNLAALRDEIVALETESKQTMRHWRLDDRLHQLFADGSGNAVMAKAIRDLRVTTRLFEVSRPFGRALQDSKEHLSILDEFAKGDVGAARKAMRYHLRQLQKEVMEILKGG